MIHNKNRWYLIFLVACLLAFTFFLIRPGFIFNQIFPTTAPHLVGISIAISEFEFGLEPSFTGFMKFNKFLLDYTRSVCTYETCTYAHINAAIGQVLKMKNVASDGLHFMFGVDPGMPLLYKLAFKGYGYRAEAPFFLVFSLLTLSVFLFLLAFGQSKSFLFLLIVFLAAHLVIALCAPFTSADLQVIFHDRFLPVYAVIPTLHLLISAFNSTKVPKVGKSKFLVCALMMGQAAILSLIVHARFAAVGFVAAVIFLPIAIYLLGLFKRNLSIQVSIVPAVFLLIIFFSLRAFIFTGLHPNYAQYGERPFHGFWHNFFIGMAAHPEAQARYNIAYDDLSGFRIVERLAPRHGYTFTLEDHISDYGYYKIGAPPTQSTEVIIQGKRYSDVLAAEYFRMLREDPLFVISSYLYKIPLFFRVFLMQEGEVTHDHFGVTRFILHPIILIFLVSGFLLARTALTEDWGFLFSLLGYTWFFSLLAPMAVIPLSHLIADASLILVMLIYSFLFYGFWHLTMRRKRAT